MLVASNSGVTLSGLTPSSGNGTNPFSAATNRLVGTTYGYDLRGDMTTLGGIAITYDAEGNQSSTADSGVGGQSISYIFDAEGQRVEKQTAGGATVVDVHDAFGRLAAEYNSAGVTPACTTCYLAYDGVGSVRLVTDQSGNVMARHDYLPFKEEIQNATAGRNGNSFAATANIAQGFTGQESYGGTAELDYFNARHMAGVLGSFTLPDPVQAGADFVNPQSWNGYGYVLGNPLGLVDPSGMFGEKPTPVQASPTQFCTILITGGEHLPQPADPCLPPVSSGYNAPSSGGSTSGGGGGGSSNSSTPAKTGTSSAPPSRLSCLSQAYATPEGKAVQFLSPISLTPLNPNWHENLAEWGLAIFGKGGGMVGSGLGAAVLEKGGLESAYSIGTLTQIHNVAAPIERALGKGLHYGEEAMLPAMAAMTLADALLQAQCAANPSAPLNGIEIGPK